MSDVTIVNQALALLAVEPLLSLQDDTVPGRTASRLYEPMLKAVLEERAWTFATDRAVLAPDATPPEFGFGNRFQLPNDTLRVLNADDKVIQAGQQGQATPLDFVKEGDYLLADSDVLYVKYVKFVTDTSIMSAGFKDCLAYKLAAEMATALTESRVLMADMQALYADKLIKSGGIDGAQGAREQKWQGNYVTRR